MRRYFLNCLSIFALCIAGAGLRADSETLSLSPVPSPATQTAVSNTDLAAADNAVGAKAVLGASRGAVPCMVPKAHAWVRGHGPVLLGFDIRQTSKGVFLLIKASGPVMGLA
ncbi:MAG TPA: hypothetical protein VK786_05910, partial [bacterium]|nr:hypothetical protein [bacterium]